MSHLYVSVATISLLAPSLLQIWALVVTVYYADEVDKNDVKVGKDWYGFLEYPSKWDGTCADGKEQSPINLDSTITPAGAFPLTFNYKTTDVAVKIQDTMHGEAYGCPATSRPSGLTVLGLGLGLGLVYSTDCHGH